MTDLDARVRRALDAQHVPDSLRQKTLAAIEEARACQGAEGASAAPGQPLGVVAPPARSRPLRHASSWPLRASVSTPSTASRSPSSAST